MTLVLAFVSEDLVLRETVLGLVTVMGTVVEHVVVMQQVKRVELQLITSRLSK